MNRVDETQRYENIMLKCKCDLAASEILPRSHLIGRSTCVTFLPNSLRLPRGHFSSFIATSGDGRMVIVMFLETEYVCPDPCAYLWDGRGRRVLQPLSFAPV